MKFLPVLLFLMLSLVVRAQISVQPGEMVVIQNKPVLFAYTDAEDMLNMKSLDNIFEVKLNSSSNPIKVYASLVMHPSMMQSDLYKSLVLQLTYKSSSAAVSQSVEVPLSSAPALLFTVPATPPDQLQQHTLMYSLKLLPGKTFVKPDTYSFTLVFSKTSL